MLQENAKKFMELLNKDEELKKKVEEAAEAYTGDRTDEKAVFEAVILPIAKEAGYEFSFEDAEELAKAAQDDELSEDEVAVAAGGGAWSTFKYWAKYVGETFAETDWSHDPTLKGVVTDAAVHAGIEVGKDVINAAKGAFYTH